MACRQTTSWLRSVALVPILAPSLLAAISFIFWFGNQGLLKPLMGEGQIYGAPGIGAIPIDPGASGESSGTSVMPRPTWLWR